MTKPEIIAMAKRKGGFFSVDRNSYHAEKLRKKLKAMANDTNCPLTFYSATQKQIVYTL